MVGEDGEQIGVVPIADAMARAEAAELDLVEIAPLAKPPVCRIMDFGKFKYREAKRAHEAKLKLNQIQVKEVKFRPGTDEGDYKIKLRNLIRFLGEGDKAKVTLRFRGREMAHQEFGFQVVKKFIRELAPYGHPDAEPKLIGKGINLMLSPLPRNKRAKNPNQTALESQRNGSGDEHEPSTPAQHNANTEEKTSDFIVAPKPAAAAFGNNPFVQLDLGPREENK